MIMIRLKAKLGCKPNTRKERVYLASGFLLLGLLLGCANSYSASPKTFQGSPMRFAVIGDRTASHQPGVYEQIIQEIERMKPDFVLSVGDMIEGYTGDTMVTKREREEYKAIIKPLTMPIYFTPGNNDIIDSTYLELYKRQVAEPYYSFDVRSVHFIVLDNSRFDSVSVFPKKQMDWLVNDLEKSKGAAYTVVVFHKPFWIETVADGKPDTLHALFKKYGVDAVFSGHYHIYFSGEFDGIRYTAVGSSGGACSPGPTGLQYHFTWVTIDKDGISIAPIKMSGVLPWDELGAREFRLVEKIQSEAVHMEKANFGTRFGLPQSFVKVNIKNLNEQVALKDTLRWDIPAGWGVTPQTVPIEVSSLESCTVSFVVKNTGPIYPAPSIFFKYPYAQGKKLEMKKTLGVSRTAYAYHASKPILIDGILSEYVWRKPVNKLFAQDGKTMTIEPVDFYFAWDQDNLYLGAKCTETKMDSMVAHATEHDGAIYTEDCVGYFIQPQTQDGPVYQIYFNPLGTPFDQKITVKNGEATAADRSWNGSYEVKTSKGENYWSIEAKIPLEQLDAKAESGKSWAISFRRKQKRLNNTADWLIPTSYDSKDYGTLSFK